MSFERIDAFIRPSSSCLKSSFALKRKRGEIEIVNEKIRTVISDILKDDPQKVYGFLNLLCEHTISSEKDSAKKNLELRTVGTVISTKALYHENLEILAVNINEQLAMKNGIKTMVDSYGLTEQWEKRVARAKEQYCFLGRNANKIAKINEQIEMAQHNYLAAKLFRKKKLNLPATSIEDLFFKELEYAQEYDPGRAKQFLDKFFAKYEAHKKLASEDLSFSIDNSLESLFFHNLVNISYIILLISDDDLLQNNAIALATLLYDDFCAKASEWTLEKDFHTMLSLCALYIAISFTSDEAIFQIDFLESVPDLKLQGVYFTKAVLAFLKTIDWKINYTTEEIEKRVSEMSNHTLYQLLHQLE